MKKEVCKHFEDNWEVKECVDGEDRRALCCKVTRVGAKLGPPEE